MPTTNYHTTPYGANLIFNEVVSLHPRALFATPDCISLHSAIQSRFNLALRLLAPLWVVRWDSNPHLPRPQRGALPLSYSQHIYNRFLYRVSLFALALDWRYNLRLPYPTLSDSAQVQSAYGLRSKVATILSRLGFAPFAASLNAPSGWCFRRDLNPEPRD